MFQRELTKILSLDKNIIFTGFVEWKNISSYYALGDLFLCDSVSETQGLTYLEALASGLPLLVRADDCLKELLVNDYNGIYYQSEEALIKNMKALREVQARLLRLKANTRSSTINYTDKIFVQRILKIYQDLLNK